MDIADVKRELSSDEKVLESAFKLETLYKKHKVKLWIIVAALVVFFGGRTLQEFIHASKLEKANEAFLVLQTKPTDKAALKRLEENNPALLELFSYVEASKNHDIKALQKLTASKNSIIADASRYTAGVLNKKPVDSKLYKEMSLLEEAYTSMEAGDKKTAQEKLDSIDERSALAVLSSFLKHSMIKAN
ncbi:hypothetical protein MNB_SV-3-72 [hydrothermal vent metagenome]|uniref:Tetratricopeptide repeat-like domain-containing protein n=1 Tax=hydrothermal vent metagenome TaxID=652676 RepID=A0A1W1CH84_9ZZZZ